MQITLKKFKRKDIVTAHKKNLHNSAPSLKYSKCQNLFTKPTIDTYYLVQNVVNVKNNLILSQNIMLIDVKKKAEHCEHAISTECPGINESSTKRTKFNDVTQSSVPCNISPLDNITSINSSPLLTFQRVDEDTAPLSTDPGVN